MSILQSIARAFSRTRGRRVQGAFPGRFVRGRYDAAQTTDTMGLHWANANASDSDACNTLSIRKKLRERMRYELANNSHARGIVSTHANYVIGIGPKLRMQSSSRGFNQMVESDWQRWCKAVGSQHKLRLLFTAKVGDGESIGRLFTNPAVDNDVKLDIALVECDRLTAPVSIVDTDQYVDGITYDEFGNPIFYDILKRHPGASWTGLLRADDFDHVPAESVVHWFRADRPGQHRGIPELTPSLNLFGQGRRFKEAVISAAETAASIAAYLEMGVSPQDDPDEAEPWTSVEIQKGMMMAGPAGATPHQMKAEQPATTYDMFIRSMVSEEARPINMPYNIAACDNKDQNFSGGRLNHHTYFVYVNVERSLAETHVVDRVFAVWFREQSALYRAAGYGQSLPTPKHSWDWPAMPQIDDLKTAKARQTALSVGNTRLGLIYADDGLDFEDELPLMAAEYGVSVDEMRKRLLDCNLQLKQQTGEDQDGSDDGRATDDDQDIPAAAGGRFSLRN